MIAYFHTSALLKLIIAEKGAEQAILLWRQASGVVASRLAWPEAVAALAVMEADSLFVTWDRRLRRAAAQAGLSLRLLNPDPDQALQLVEPSLDQYLGSTSRA